MHKILTAVAVVALVALGTSIIATVLLHSSIARQSRQIGALAGAENADHQKIAALESEVGATTKHKKLTASTRQCRQDPQPTGQPRLAFAAPEFLFAIRQDALTVRSTPARIRVSSGSSASGRCG